MEGGEHVARKGKQSAHKGRHFDVKSLVKREGISKKEARRRLKEGGGVIWSHNIMHRRRYGRPRYKKPDPAITENLGVMA